MRYVVAQPSDPELSASLAVVVGRNCRDIRSKFGATQDDLARHARSIGLDWTQTRVGHFEAGRSAPTFAAVLAVTLALELARQHSPAEQRDADSRVTLADLLTGYGFVELTETLNTVPAGWVADVCRGRAVTWPPADEYWRDVWPSQEVEPGVKERRAARTAKLVKQAQAQMAADLTLDTEARSGLTEQRLAKDLGVSPGRLANLSLQLWGGTFSEQRDHRAGAHANPQKKGRITRELRAELEKAMADGND